jgi:excisionase family DNA binding protein
MTAKATVAARLPVRRGLSEIEAAVYLSLSPTKFREMVADGRMPQPRVADGRLIWDVQELDAAFKALPRRGGENSMFGAKLGDSWDDYEWPRSSSSMWSASVIGTASCGTTSVAGKAHGSR